MIKFLIKIVVIVAAATMTLQANALDSQTRNGNFLTAGLPLVAAGLSLTGDDSEGFVQFLKSEAATLLIVEAMKSTTNQTRPNGADNKSFPSAHTAMAFSAAHFMQMKGGWEYGLPSYIAASYVANSRVEAREHRWRDVVTGGAVGALTTQYFTSADQSRRFGASLAPRSMSLLIQQSFD